jgi:hypothetical protein
MWKGWAKLGAGTLVGNWSLDLPKIKLPAASKRVGSRRYERRSSDQHLKRQVTFLKTSLVERNELVVPCTPLFHSFSGFTRASPVKQGFHS